MNWWVGWLVVLVVLGVVEVWTLTLAAGILAGGAAIAAVVGAFGLGLPVQAIAFGVASFAGLILIRPLALHRLQPSLRLRTGTRALVGRPARVVQEVTGEAGRVRISGEEWSARAFDDTRVIPVGALVDVFEIEGATALVHPRD